MALVPGFSEPSGSDSQDLRRIGAAPSEPRRIGAARAESAQVPAKLAPNRREPTIDDINDLQGEGQAPPPALRDGIDGQNDQTQGEILAAGYMDRRRGPAGIVAFEEAVAEIAKHLQRGVSGDLLATFLDATPSLGCYPRELATEAAAWARAEQQQQVRERVDRIRREGRTAAYRALPGGGQEIGHVRFADAAADPPHLVIEVDRTPPTPTRQDRMADLEVIVAATAWVSPGCPTVINGRAELARLEAGGEPEPPAPEVERLDLRTLEDLDGWQFRAPDGGPTLQDLRRQRGPDAPSPGDAPPPAEPDLAIAQQGASP